MAAKKKVPRKYVAGLDSKTAAARKAAIRARSGKAPSYAPLPGDKTANGKQRPTKPSKHTTAYKKRFGSKNASKK